jgi:hypothetical protein
MHYFVIAGSTAAGKSTTERNLRLRLTGELALGEHQPLPEQGLVFAGRVLYNSGKRVLRFSGGDSTSFQRDNWKNLFDAREIANKLKEGSYSKVIFERYHLTEWVVRELIARGHKMTWFHLEVPRELAAARLRKLDHPKADSPKHIYYNPGKPEFQKERDAYLAELGVQVIYLYEDLPKRLAFIEDCIGVTPQYEYYLYDFQDSVESIYQRFFAGGDCPRSLELL